MQPSEKKVLVLLALLAEQSGDKVSEARLDFIAEELCALGAEKACVALKKLLESARRFPTVAEVKAEMGLGEPTTRDVGNMIAGVIVQAISRVGVPVGPKGQAALDDMLGPAARIVVQKLGGWAMVVDQAGENLTALKAQIRDLAEAYTRTGEIDPAEIPKEVPAYSAALEIAGAKLKDLPALSDGKRLPLEEQKQNLLKIREDLGAGKITDDEALDLIELAEKQRQLKEDEIPW